MKLTRERLSSFYVATADINLFYESLDLMQDLCPQQKIISNSLQSYYLFIINHLRQIHPLP